MDESFHTTRWTLVRHATAGASEALSELCDAYYAPVVAFLRRSGLGEDVAREASHGFFEAILQKPSLGGAQPGRGRFRSYLLGALKHHLANVRARDNRGKRGGGAVHVMLGGGGTIDSPGLDIPDTALSPDREFDRQWALHTLRRAMNSLETEWAKDGKAEEFARLRPFIAGDAAHGDLAALATALGEDAAVLRKTASRIRQRFRQHMRLIIASTLEEPDAVEEEMHSLFIALSE